MARATYPLPFPLTERDLQIAIPHLRSYCPLASPLGSRVWSRRNGWMDPTVSVFDADRWIKTEGQAGIVGNHPLTSETPPNPLGIDPYVLGRVNVPALDRFGARMERNILNLATAAAYRDLTDVDWTLSDATIENLNIILGDHSVVLGQNRLLATLANATAILDLGASANALHAFGILIKRAVGTGVIELTMDGGATWIDVTSQVVANDWTWIEVNQTLADPDVGVRIVTQGDEISIDMVTVISGRSMVGSPVVGGATKVPDSLRYSNVDEVLARANRGTAAMIYTPHYDPTEIAAVAGRALSIGVVTDSVLLSIPASGGASGQMRYELFSGGVLQNNIANTQISAETPTRIVITWGDGVMTMRLDGVLEGPRAIAASPTPSADWAGTMSYCVCCLGGQSPQSQSLKQIFVFDEILSVSEQLALDDTLSRWA